MKKKNIINYVITFVVFSIILIPNVYAWCPLGEDVTKDLYGALKIMKIIAPLLVIVYTVIDVIKTVAKGDAEADAKKVAQTFIKRVIYAVLLFFLPILVDQTMQIADVWGVNGSCDLKEPKSNNASREDLFGESGTDPVCKTYDLNPDECIAHGCVFIQGYCVAKNNNTNN